MRWPGPDAGGGAAAADEDEVLADDEVARLRAVRRTCGGPTLRAGAARC